MDVWGEVWKTNTSIWRQIIRGIEAARGYSLSSIEVMILNVLKFNNEQFRFF
jgi:hypothetical protein